MKIYKITEASEYLGVSINTLKTLSNKDVAGIKQADENKSKIVEIKACPHTREML